MEDGFEIDYSAPGATITRPPYRPFWWLKWLYRLIIGLMVLAVVLGIAAVIGRYVLLSRARARTAEVIANLDRSDPGWRLEDIEAARKVYSESENSAGPMIAAYRLIPKDWPGSRATKAPRDPGLPLPKPDPRSTDALIEGSSAFRPDAEQAEIIRKELGSVGLALIEARKVADRPGGRYELTWALNPLETLLPHTQNSRQIARLLKLDAILRAHDGDLDGAVASCRAILNAGRSIGDEPLVISQLVRIAEQTVAFWTLESVLSMGEPSDESLAAIQQLLETEDAEFQLRPALRGERAELDLLYGRIVRGELKSFTREEIPTAMQWLWGEWMCTYAWGVVLEEMNEAVAIADVPISDLRDRLEEWNRGVASRYAKGGIEGFSRLMLPAVSSFADSYVMSHARLRSAIVAVATERYRRKNGRWPASVDDLTPWPLAKVPDDPCTDQKLIWMAEDETLAIYSTGPDKADDGGALEQEVAASDRAKTSPRGQPYWQGKDFGLRLLDPASRHK